MPSDVPLRTLRKRLETNGWVLARITKHHIFTGPGRPTISIPVHRGKVKDVYRRQVEKAIRELEREEGDG